MRIPNSGRAMGGVLLAALFSSMSAHAAVTDTKIMLQAQPVSVVADTLAKVREGSVNAGGVNWACSGVRCNTMASAAAAPLALCQGLAREVGALRSFIVANRPLNGNELQQCNSVAPAATAALPGMKTPQGAGLPPAAPVPSVGLLPLQPPAGLAPTPAQAAATPAPNTSQHKDRLITPKDFTPMASPPPAEPERVTVKPGQPGPLLLQPPPAAGDGYKVRGGEDNKINVQFGDGASGRRLPSGENDIRDAYRTGNGAQDVLKPGMIPRAVGPIKEKEINRKAFTPSGGAASPPPSPAETTPGSRSYPVRIRTEGLTVTGTGGTLVRLPVTSKRIRTEGLTVTGTGTGTGTEVRLPVTSKRIRTEGLTVTGTGTGSAR